MLEQLQPGALGTMLVVELKTEKGAEKKCVIKQVRKWLLGKQESIGMFVISMDPSDGNRDKHVGQLGLGKSRLTIYCAAVLEMGKFRSVYKNIEVKNGKRGAAYLGHPACFHLSLLLL